MHICESGDGNSACNPCFGLYNEHVACEEVYVFSIDDKLMHVFVFNMFANVQKYETQGSKHRTFLLDHLKDGCVGGIKMKAARPLCLKLA